MNGSFFHKGLPVADTKPKYSRSRRDYELGAGNKNVTGVKSVRRANPLPKMSYERYSPNHPNPTGDLMASTFGFQRVPEFLPNQRKKPFKKRTQRTYTPEELKELTAKYYAGAKFCDHPPPSELPPPPSHWLTDMGHNSEESDLTYGEQVEYCKRMSYQLKKLLKVKT